MLALTKVMTTALLLTSGVVSASTNKTIAEVLGQSPEWNEEMFKALLARHDLNHLLLSDVNALIAHLRAEFPEIITVKSIGQTYQNRDMLMIEINARDFILNKLGDVGSSIRQKLDPVMPAIMLTGAHHARELLSVQMPIYSILRMLHGGIIHNDEKYQNLLIQNKYYVMPVTNVDGLADIEQHFEKTGEWLTRRKNMNFENTEEGDCSSGYEERGVDINRNYGVDWDKSWNGGNSEDPCA